MIILIIRAKNQLPPKEQQQQRIKISETLEEQALPLSLFNLNNNSLNNMTFDTNTANAL